MRKGVARYPNALAGNPSPYRQGIVVQLDGECGHRLCLSILQHKGQTFLGLTASEVKLDDDAELPTGSTRFGE